MYDFCQSGRPVGVGMPWAFRVMQICPLLSRTRLYARPELAAELILVIYEPLTGLGMWLVNP